MIPRIMPLTYAERKKIADQMHRYIAKAQSRLPGKRPGYAPSCLCLMRTRDIEKSIKELTVHHKDHNHDNNSPVGSNWGMLCIYCHDHE